MWLLISIFLFFPSIFAANVDLLIAESLSSVDYTDCGSTAYIGEFTVSRCTSQPCLLTRGLPYSINLVGILQTSLAASLPFTVIAWKWGLVSYDLISEDGCDYLVKGKCPLQFGDEFEFQINITPSDSLPNVSVLIEAQLKDEKGNMIICADLNVQVD